jgi:CBS domain-containing protein
MQKASDIMTSKPVVVHRQDRIENVLELMRKHGLSKIPVVDDGKLVGILHDGDILEELGAFKNREISPTTMHVSGAMQRKFEVAFPDTDLKVVVEACKQDNVGLLPVVERNNGNPEGKLVGVITKADLLPLVQSSTPLRDLMKKTLHSVGPDERLIHARRLMVDHGIERLPVLDQGRLVGILGEMDIAIALDRFKKHVSVEHQKNQIKDLHVRDVMVTEVVTAPPDWTAKKAAQVMKERDVGCLPIVQGAPGENRIAGMVTRTDLLRTI